MTCWSQVTACKYPRRVWFVDALPKGPTAILKPGDRGTRRTQASARSHARRRLPGTPDPPAVGEADVVVVDDCTQYLDVLGPMP
jgi:hypothetical protein